MADAPSNASLTGGEPSPRRFSLVLRPWMFTVGVLALCGVILRTEGRRWWCACGDWSPWAGNIWSSHCSQHLFDPYAFTHVSHGLWLWFIVGWIRPTLSDAWRLRFVVMFEAGWEILENSPLVIDRYRTATVSLDYVGDSVFNSLGDIVACLVGALAARKLGFARSLAVFIAIEIVLAFAIRDTLSLNVLMLLRPIEAVKQWQMSGH